MEEENELVILVMVPISGLQHKPGCVCTAERSNTLKRIKPLLIISEHEGSVPRINCPIMPHSADPASFKGTCRDLLAAFRGWVPEEQD